MNPQKHTGWGFSVASRSTFEAFMRFEPHMWDFSQNIGLPDINCIFKFKFKAYLFTVIHWRDMVVNSITAIGITVRSQARGRCSHIPLSLSCLEISLSSGFVKYLCKSFLMRRIFLLLQVSLILMPLMVCLPLSHLLISVLRM